MTRNFEGVDQESLDLLKKMKESGIETSFDRYDAQQPQCGYGKIGLCCRHCQMGPCNVDPFGRGPQRGVCGADANTIAARHFVRYVAAGTAAHSDHGRSVAELLIATARGEAKGDKITDTFKLFGVAKVLDVHTLARKSSAIVD